MKNDSEVTYTCSGCGATIYKEHLGSGIARYVGDKLLCAHCVTEQEDAAATENEAPIILEGQEESAGDASDMSSSRIHAMSTATLGQAGGWDESKFKRPLRPDGPAATRCRTFHCKLSDGAVDFLNSQINEWLDSQENVTAKFATSTIGAFEGKHVEPNLIITVFY